MGKKLFLVCFLIFVVGSLAIVSAGETVSIRGVDFNIPDGYEVDNTFADLVLPTGLYLDGKGNQISIYVGENMGYDDLYDKGVSYEDKTINDKGGKYASTDDGEEFIYFDGDKCIKIATNETDLLKEIII